ncbi:hypothetical protein EG68_04125 [Paragonimus skrjabini miyazakii]|uniref:Uncharacterized protein n=1 Tax=Paragonimus skrjabini miyazakii TaxID=59628 RepID=A0A8S9YUF2_9TREM|nr:hypothetical protein EG68_04125 [Paragonimus skrjabini miyazakii]
MWTGKELRLPSALQTPYLGRLPLLTTEYVISLRDTIVRSHELARRHSNADEQRQKEYYDKEAHEAFLRVYLRTDVPSPGVYREWKGPFVVQQVLSYTLCYIRSTDSCQKPMVVHFNRLKPTETSTEAGESEGVPEIGAEVGIANDLSEAPGRYLVKEGKV